MNAQLTNASNKIFLDNIISRIMILCNFDAGEATDFGLVAILLKAIGI